MKAPEHQMKNIDFLPAAYRQQHARRNVHLWRVLVVLMFAVLFSMASLVQYLRLCRARDAQKNLAAQYATAESQNRQLARLQAQREMATGDAELLTYLRHPWPRSQILAALLAPLPDSITLSQLEIKTGSTTRAARAFRQLPGGIARNEEVETPTLPARRDLLALRQQFDSTPAAVVVSGRTTDPAALHRYLDELHRCSLFPRIELDTLEIASPGADVPDGMMNFTAVVELLPGHGQPGGPVASAPLQIDHARVEPNRSETARHKPIADDDSRRGEPPW